MSNLSIFPEGYFYILSRKHGFALDVYDGQIKEGANLIVWPQKFQDSDNQLWSFENGRLTNKKSGHVMDISSSAFKSDKSIVQKKRKANKQSQEWIYDQGFICSKEYPSLVLDIRGDSPKGGAQVLLYKRKDTDNLNQLWQFEPYQQFENALNMATTSVPLHKKEGFGQPRPGYAAEPGVPPELKKVPENNKIAGVGNNVSPTPTTNAAGNSRVDPVLANYGSFYGGTSTAPPPPQAGQVPSSNNYPPRNDNYPPPSAQPGQAPSPSSFPEPIPSNATSSFSPPPPPPANTGGYSSNYPPAHQSPSNYPPPPQSPSNYPPPPQSPPSYPPQHVTSGSGYPPSSPSNYNSVGGYQQQSSGYPSAPINQMSTSPPSYPSYPPSNANSGYPPVSSSGGGAPGFPQPPQDGGNNFYQQQGMSGAGNPNQGYPPPPSLPGNRPNNNQQQHDQYGYPSYPQ